MRLLIYILALALIGCDNAHSKPKKGRTHTTATSTPIATLQFPTPTATEVPTPPVKNVAPKVQPATAPKETVKSVVNSLPTVQSKRWHDIKIKPSYDIAVNKAVMRYTHTHQRYETVE